jgi:hypothetical protein
MSTMLFEKVIKHNGLEWTIREFLGFLSAWHSIAESSRGTRSWRSARGSTRAPTMN